MLRPLTRRSIEELLRQQYEISARRVNEASEYADKLGTAEANLHALRGVSAELRNSCHRAARGVQATLPIYCSTVAFNLAIALSH